MPSTSIINLLYVVNFFKKGLRDSGPPFFLLCPDQQTVCILFLKPYLFVVLTLILKGRKIHLCLGQ